MFSLTWPPSVFQKRTSPPVHHSAAIEHWTPRNNVENIARLGTTVMRTLRCSFWGNAPIGKEPSTGKASEMKRVRSRRIGRPRRSVQKRPRVRRKDLPTVKLPGLSRGGGGKTKADEPSRRGSGDRVMDQRTFLGALTRWAQWRPLRHRVAGLRIPAIVISWIGASRSPGSGHRDRSGATPGRQGLVELGLLSP
jgi:hypothetical protein